MTLVSACGGGGSGVNAPSSSDFPALSKTVGDAPFLLTAPASTDSAPFTYTSDNTAVATIAGSTVTIVAAGVTRITATQLKDNFPIMTKSALLTVAPAASGSTPAVKTVLLNLNSATPLPAFGSRAISATVNSNGSPAQASSVSFTASCGSVTPATVTSDASSGAASTTYMANPAANDGCGGSTVTITATVAGAAAATGTINVQSALAANVQFVSATPQLLYLAGAGGAGATQSVVSFRAVDAGGTPLGNQALTLSLSNLAAGVAIGAPGSQSSVTLTTGSNGQVSVPVFSGTIPTSVQVSAALASRPDIKVASNALTIASGVPAQKSVSLALEKFSIEGLFNDGIVSNVSFSLADRQGNPVPVGTTVNFVASHGVMVPATCTVPALPDGSSASACTSTIRAQGARPANGKVVILAYAVGEEDFVDLNGNNVYDAGEPFTDMGAAYRDDDLSLSYTAGEFIVPRPPRNGGAAVACPASVNGVLGQAGTCDGVWGTVDVRAQRTVVFASGSVNIAAIGTSIGSGTGVSITDLRGNSPPTGSTISVASGSSNPACAPTIAPAIVSNTVGAFSAAIKPTACAAGDPVTISVTSPLGVISAQTLTLTP